MRLYPLAYMAGLLPLLTINLTWLLAADAGQVAWCIPYIESCTSISATGRSPPASFVFKGLMIPAALLLMLYWLLNAQWLRQLGSRQRNWHNALVALGLLAGPGLIFHVLLLGEDSALYRQPRHWGVAVFSVCTFFAQVLFTALLQRLPLRQPGLRRRVRRRLLWLWLLLLLDILIGLANVLSGQLSPTLYAALSNAFAWNFMLLLCLHVILTADLWYRTDWRATLSTKHPD